MLAYMSIINKLRQLTNIVDGIKLLKNIHKAMLVHNNLQLYVVVLDQENINIPNEKLFY